MALPFKTEAIKKGLTVKTIIYSSYLVIIIASVIIAVQIYTNYYKKFYFSVSDFEKTLLSDELLNVEPIKYKEFEKELANIASRQTKCKLGTISKIGN